MTNALEREYIMLYEAKITTELLGALKNWMDATIPIQRPTIQQKRIPYKPYDTFDSRLKTEIGETSPLPSHILSNTSDDVDGVDEYSGKRSYEPEDSGSSKMMRIWERRAGLLGDLGVGNSSAC